MQIVSLKVRNHTIIKSWRQGRTIQFLLSALSEKNWGAKHFFQPMIKTSIKHIICFNCIHPSLLMCGWLGFIGLWILGLGEGLGFWLDCLYCETGRDHFLIFWSELQKRADRADQSVLFFLACANFWEKHAKNRRKHAKTGEKQALFWC